MEGRLPAAVTCRSTDQLPVLWRQSMFTECTVQHSTSMHSHDVHYAPCMHACTLVSSSEAGYPHG